ncbi:Holliday junction DNA helicase subunit RuvA [Dietzia kunjamensis]|uniref:Holliday junction branch migration protein RuvA n=1 Tax=Dietzia kunjamensis TaxID=322509 RepID=UPI000E7599E0|nr:Holliday junction branch migration protein RuvA [Dietzia kunjamensis]MBB1011992.1 Holliday junction branch migration protein RuvA [Dietzia kunjamensis]RKE66492.1 Holliday junction DNA helicase subunit RuvA [Dietzia kunjamensis]
MIASIRGTVAEIGLDRCVVETGGVGVLVHATPAALAGLRRGAEGMLHTELVVREDSLTLYGFDSVDARQLFLTVQTVSGVGPRLALAIVATLEPEVLVRALGTGDVRALTRVPGVGKRTAERMVLELKDKVGPVSDDGSVGIQGGATGGSAATEVAEALEGLGFSSAEAEKTATAVLAAEPDLDPAQALRLALKSLGRR